MNLLEKLAVLGQLDALWKRFKGLEIGERDEAPLTVVRIGKKEFELGPLPVRRRR